MMQRDRAKPCRFTVGRFAFFSLSRLSTAVVWLGILFFYFMFYLFCHLLDLLPDPLHMAD